MNSCIAFASNRRFSRSSWQIFRSAFRSSIFCSKPSLYILILSRSISNFALSDFFIISFSAMILSLLSARSPRFHIPWELLYDSRVSDELLFFLLCNSLMIISHPACTFSSSSFFNASLSANFSSRKSFFASDKSLKSYFSSFVSLPVPKRPRSSLF